MVVGDPQALLVRLQTTDGDHAITFPRGPTLIGERGCAVSLAASAVCDHVSLASNLPLLATCRSKATTNRGSKSSRKLLMLLVARIDHLLPCHWTPDYWPRLPTVWDGQCGVAGRFVDAQQSL